MNSTHEEPDLSRLRIERQKEAGPARGLVPILVGLVMVLLIVCAVLYLRETADRESAVQVASSASGAPSAVEAPPRPSALSATGYVVAQRKAAVSSKATGRLKELNVVEGDVVKEGEVIGVLENDDLAALVRALEADTRSSQARVGFAQAELEDAGLHRARMIELAKQGVVSQAELDQAQARYKKAAADLEMARASVGAAEAQLARARIDLDYTYIRAPFDGTVLTKDADVGEIVAPFGSSADARAAIATIADMSSLEVEADVSESNIMKVYARQECHITLDSFPGKTYRGEVSNIVPTVDRAKATVLVKIRFIDKDEHVIPEMSARVEFK